MKFEVTGVNIITKDFGTSDDDFWVNAEVDISEIRGYGAETFNVNAVGVARIKKISENEHIMGRGLIISKEFDKVALQNILQDLLKKVNADSWEEFCIEFGKHFDHL